MTRKLKPVEVELSEEVQQAVLSLPVKNEDGSATSVGDLIREASEALARANAAIQENALIQLTASHLMKQEKRRGHPSIGVKLDGTAVLRIAYGTTAEAPQAPAPLAPKSKLPSLPTLRQKAEALGVDISDLGRKKKLIIERLEEAEEKPPARLRDEVSESPLNPTSFTLTGGSTGTAGPSR